MAKVRLDRAHIQRITAILETFDGANIPHAMLACEDAYAALALGLLAGLPSVADVLINHLVVVKCEDDSSVSECGKIAGGEQYH